MSPTACWSDCGGGEWRPGAAPGLLDGCILEAAMHPGEGGVTDLAPHVAQLPRSTSTQGAPQALTAAVAAPRPCYQPREFVRRPLWLPPCPATGAPGRRRRGRLRGGDGSVSVGSDRPRAPLPIVPPRRHLACTAETVVSRETRTLDMPSDSACLPTPHPPGRAHSRRSPPGDRSLRRASSSSAAPSGDHRSRGPPARQPCAAGAPRPAISAAASRYATAPAEAGS